MGMKKLLLVLGSLLLLLTACGDDETGISTEQFEGRIFSAINKMGDNTNLKIIETETNEEGRYVISLSDKTFMFLEDNKATVANTLDAPEKDVKQSLLLLVGAMDESLSMSDRNLLIQEVAKDEFVNKNGISYIYQKNDSILLQAKK